MKLHEIRQINDDYLYERFMESDTILEEDAKELFAAGKKKLGDAAEKLKGAVDAPAQKAWAEVQSRLATAGKDDAIGKLKDFASKHKVAIGTLAILGAGLMASGDASAADAAGQAAGFAGQAADAAAGSSDVLKDVLATVQEMGAKNGMDLSGIGDKLQNVQVQGVSIQDYAEQVNNAVNSAQDDPSKAARMAQAGKDNMSQAIIDAVKSQQPEQSAQAGSQVNPDGSSQFTGQDGRKVNFGKSVGGQVQDAMKG